MASHVMQSVQAPSTLQVCLAILLNVKECLLKSDLFLLLISKFIIFSSFLIITQQQRRYRSEGRSPKSAQILPAQVVLIREKLS